MQQMAKAPKHVILTGPPGVGKTTLVQKACKLLKDQQIPLFGFYTEEIRDPSSHKRIGFQVITLNGQIATLASISSKSSHRVGQYGVEITEFEKVALPSLNVEEMTGVIVLDEVGKMEMFSEKFKAAVKQAFLSPGIRILTTIPITQRNPIEFVENIRHHSDARLFTVDKSNRNQILPEIIATITGSRL